MDGQKKIYRIKGWHSHYEKRDQRVASKNPGPLTWVATPTKHSGMGFLYLLTKYEDPVRAVAHFGVWNILLQIAAAMPYKLRGYLVRDNGEPLSASDIALRVPIPAQLIQETLDRLISNEIGWIEIVDRIDGRVVDQHHASHKPEPAREVTPLPETPAPVVAQEPAPSETQTPLPPTSETQAPAAEADEPKKKGKTIDPNPKYSDGFEKFWAAWPQHSRKKAKPQCFDKWNVQNLEPRADDIVRAVEAAKKTRDWLKDSGQFIPAPLPWLNQQAYDAFLTAPAPQKASMPAPEVQPAEPIVMLTIPQRRQWTEYLASKKQFAVGAIKEPPTLPADHPFYSKEFGQVELAGAA